MSWLEVVRRLKAYAEDERALHEDGYRELVRRAEQVFAQRQRRARQPRVKEQIVRERRYENIRLKSEDVAEFVYQPVECKREYRFVVLRKNLSVERREQVLFDDVRYFFFFVTNDPEMTAEEVVRTGRKLLPRLLAWRPQLPVFFRLLDGL